MCDECYPITHFYGSDVEKTIYGANKNDRINKLGFYHCLDAPSHYNLSMSREEWFINGIIVGSYLSPVSSYEEFIKSPQYREWKLKAFK